MYLMQSFINNDAKKMRVEKKIIDNTEIALPFIDYFLNLLMLEPSKLYVNKTIKEYSKMTYDNNIYLGDKIIDTLNIFRQEPLIINAKNKSYTNNGSRGIHYLISGDMSSNNITRNFVISLNLVNTGTSNYRDEPIKQWTITDMILQFI